MQCVVVEPSCKRSITCQMTEYTDVAFSHNIQTKTGLNSTLSLSLDDAWICCFALSLLYTMYDTTIRFWPHNAKDDHIVLGLFLLGRCIGSEGRPLSLNIPLKSINQSEHTLWSIASNTYNRTNLNRIHPPQDVYETPQQPISMTSVPILVERIHTRDFVSCTEVLFLRKCQIFDLMEKSITENPAETLLVSGTKR